MTPEQTDVVVVGAGPTGLMAAGDLATAGVRTTVLERRAQESNLTRAFGVHARTLEQMDARGLADELIATGSTVRSLRLFGTVAVDLTRLPSRFPYLLVTPQYQVERLLAGGPSEHGAHIVGGAEVTDVQEDPEGVVAEMAGGRRNPGVLRGRCRRRRTARSGRSWACHSPARSMLQSIMLADVRLAERPRGRTGLQRGRRLLRVLGSLRGRLVPCLRLGSASTRSPIQLRSISTRSETWPDAPWEPTSGCTTRAGCRGSTTTSGRSRRYRVGRVFLAGDAAHVHSLAGGQGMNTGIQDAANLGWKLAASVRGWAPDGLLDTYHDERHPVGAMVIRGSGAIIRSATFQSRAQRAARNLIGSAALKIPLVARRVAGMISGIGISYPAPRGAHTLTGTRAADMLLAGHGQPEDRLFQMLRDSTFVLLAPHELSPVAGSWRAARLATAARADAPITLVRPDGYIAWATDQGTPKALKPQSAMPSPPTVVRP